jgi:hypothetical protein
MPETRMRRASGRKRTQPSTLTYDADGELLAGGVPFVSPRRRARRAAAPKLKSGTTASRSSRTPLKRGGGGGTPAKKREQVAAGRAMVSDEEARALVGRCIRIDWPVEIENEKGEYTAMVFSYMPRKRRYKLFYYQTLASAENCEEVDLFDGSRFWRFDDPPGAPRTSPSGKQVPDPRNLIGRRIGVEWPAKDGGESYSFDAVIVDKNKPDNEFRIIYVDDEYVENRDLVRSDLRWVLYDREPDPPETSLIWTIGHAGPESAKAPPPPAASGDAASGVESGGGENVSTDTEQNVEVMRLPMAGVERSVGETHACSSGGLPDFPLSAPPPLVVPEVLPPLSVNVDPAVHGGVMQDYHYPVSDVLGGGGSTLGGGDPTVTGGGGGVSSGLQPPSAVPKENSDSDIGEIRVPRIRRQM